MKTKQNFTIDQMRSQIKEYADVLSPETIPTAYDFLADLADKESEAATAELLTIEFDQAPPNSLLEFAGILSAEEAAELQEIIAQEFEKVDLNSW